MEVARLLYIRLLPLLLTLLLHNTGSSQYYITTIAGNGSNGSAGDSGPAVCAGVPNPHGVCADPTGNVYITSSNSIRRVDAATNVITTIAGSDSYGFSGDGGPARNALMMFPFDICLDPIGNLYISEYGGHRIRKISSDGTITTVAGTGVVGYTGDGGPATAARINTPQGIFVDGQNNLYIADAYNSVVRRVDAVTGIINTIAGNGSSVHSGDGGPAVNAGVPNPTSIAVDADGNVYLAEVSGGITSRVRKIDAITGIIITIAGSNVYGHSGDGGLAVNANLLDPVAVEVDNQRHVYILEYDEPRLRKIDEATGIITTVAGNGTNNFAGDGGLATLGSMFSPGGMGRGFNGSIYIADVQNQRIRKLHPDQAEPVTLSKVTVKGPPGDPCTGSSLTFTAAVNNSGSQANYQWYINNNSEGSNSTSFSTSAAKEGDSVYCVFSSVHCTGTEIITSNKVAVHYVTGVSPEIDIAASDDKVCRGEPVTITATVQHAVAPVYQWYKNDVAAGTNEATYNYLPEESEDMIRCDITTTGCAGVVISSRVISVGTFAMPEISVTPEEAVVKPGSPVVITARINGAVDNYSWSSVEGLINETTLNPTTVPVVNSHSVFFTAETADGCVIRDTVNIYVFVKMLMPNAFSPNGDGVNDVFRIPANVTFQLDEFTVFNRWGKKVFTTSDISKGWSGDDAENGIYVYMIVGVLEGRKTVFKGSFVLAR